MRFIFFCLKVALIIFAYNKISQFADQQTDKFRVLRMISNLKVNAKWAVEPPNAKKQEEIDTILSQEFRYLGSGGQCWAFVSDDNDYVIKFFKHHRRTLPTVIRALPLPQNLAAKREHRLANKQRKLQRDFDSYKLCYQRLPEETGLIYIHLNKTSDLNKSINIYDKLNIKHTIDLDGVEFVLQKRARLVHPHIHDLMKRGDIDSARSAIRSIIELITTRCQKGVFDEDPRIHRNFGFIDNHAVIIDVGRLVNDPKRKDPDIIKRDLHKITLRFKVWLDEHYNTLTPILDEELDRATDSSNLEPPPQEVA